VFFVYLLASKPDGTLYVGVTSDVRKRVCEHKSKAVAGFTVRYGVNKLVWFEAHDSVEAAIRREKQIKEWRRRLEDKFDRARQSTLDRPLPKAVALVTISLLVLTVRGRRGKETGRFAAEPAGLFDAGRGF
jgi:putative endonuclease